VTSTDGGASWQYDGVPEGADMTCAQFVGVDTLMIAGEFGVMTRNLTSAPLP